MFGNFFIVHCMAHMLIIAKHMQEVLENKVIRFANMIKIASRADFFGSG